MLFKGCFTADGQKTPLRTFRSLPLVEGTIVECYFTFFPH